MHKKDVFHFKGNTFFLLLQSQRKIIFRLHANYAGGPLQNLQTTKYMTMANPTKRAIAKSLYMSKLKLSGLSYGLSLIVLTGVSSASGSALFTRSRMESEPSIEDDDPVWTRRAIQRKRSARLKLVKFTRSILVSFKSVF